MYLLATILSLDNVVALCKKPHLPAQLISMPEKSFAIGYRSGLLAYMDSFESFTWWRRFPILNITLKEVKFGFSSLTKI